MADRDRREVDELAGEFRGLAVRLARTNDVDAALTQVAVLATGTIPGCDWAGITQFGPRGEFYTLVASDPMVRVVDEFQYTLRQGPCVDAAVEDGVFLAQDLRRSATWPRFGARAVAASPVRTTLSLTVSPVTPGAALNLYGRRPGVFTTDSVDTATVFAAHVQVLLMYARAADKVINLTQALTTSRLIGSAVGILMYAHKITADEAFVRLRAASQQLNRKLSDIADEITQTGMVPSRRRET